MSRRFRLVTVIGLGLVPVTGTAQNDAGLTAADRAAFASDVAACWSLDNLSDAARATTVRVSVTLSADGVPDAATVRLVSGAGGDDAATRQAFEAARRAIIRCGTYGYKLPPEKYAQWAKITMIFDPETVRIE